MIAIIILRIAFQKSMAWRITVRSITKLFRMWYACATRTWRYFQNTEPEKTQLKALFLHMYFNFSSSYASSDPLSNLPSVQDGPGCSSQAEESKAKYMRALQRVLLFPVSPLSAAYRSPTLQWQKSPATAGCQPHSMRQWGPKGEQSGQFTKKWE